MLVKNERRLQRTAINAPCANKRFDALLRALQGVDSEDANNEIVRCTTTMPTTNFYLDFHTLALSAENSE